MRRIFLLNNEKGIVLVGVVALMIFLGLFGVAGVSMLGSSAGSHKHLVQGTQALALARAGVEWYMEQLERDPDWTDQGNETRNFAAGRFNITIGPASERRLTFTSTGTVTSPLTGVDLRRTATLTALRLSPAFQYAVFKGTDSTLTIQSSGSSHSTIRGDIWSRGSVIVQANNRVLGGKVYVPSNRNVTGTGTYRFKRMDAPVPVMPELNTAFYDGLAADYEEVLSDPRSGIKQLSSGTFNINTDPSCDNGVCGYAIFQTSGQVTITGNGFIAANILQLHTAGSVTGSHKLTVQPSPGGRIVFLASGIMQVGSTSQLAQIQLGAGTRFYSGSILQVDRSTPLENVLMICSSGIMQIRNGAQVTGNSILYSGGGIMQVTGVATGSQTTTVEGSLLSQASILQITNGGSSRDGVLVRGLVYSEASIFTIQDATIEGSVAAGALSNITNASVTYKSEYLPEDPPPGFEAYVMKRPDSWSGL